MWIVLRENKQNIQRKELQEALSFLKLCMLMFVGLLMQFFRKERYFITFIDDYSRYSYVYLLHEKSQSVDALEIYLNEVERQLDRNVKVFRSDRCG